MPQLDLGVLTEPDRLASVRRIRMLLSSSAARIDGLVFLASGAAAAPMGLLTLVDEDRLHIIGGHGRPSHLEALKEASLSSSFCQYVVSVDAPLAIADAREDDQLRDTIAVRTLGVVSYLGYPVHDGRGKPLGTLCVADTVPRAWTDRDVAALGEAARWLETLLETESTLHDTVLASAQVDTVLEEALEAFVAIELTGLTGHVTKWNRGAERTFGWPAHEAIGRNLEELIIPERFRAAHRGAITRLASGGVPRLAGQRLQLWALGRDGHEFPVEMTLNVIDHPEGRHAQAFLYDITERVTAERHLSRERRFLQALLDSLDVGVSAVDQDGKPVLSNNTMRGIGEVSPDTAELPDGTELGDRDMPMARAFAGEHVREAELVVHSPGTRPRTFLANGQPIRDAAGARLGAVIALHEVTDRRRAQRFLECELAVSRVLEDATTVEDAGPGVLEAVATALRWPHSELWLVDKVGNVLRNAAYYTDPRYEIREFLPGPIANGAGMSGRAWAENKPIWVPDISVDPNLTARSSLAKQGLKVGLAVPIRDAGGVTGVLTFFGDAAEPVEESLLALLAGIAAHVGQFLERRRAEDLAQQLARTKDEFISLVGHELRTPLTNISSYTELLLAGVESTEQGERLLGVVARNAQTLRAVIDDLLDLAGLESGYVTINSRPFDLGPVVREVIDDLMSTATEKQLALNLTLPPGDVWISGDATRIGKVVCQVVANAVKYTPVGGRIDVELGVDCAIATLRVTDTGVGIPDDERERLFQRFFRGSNVRSEGLPGVGLGLAISRTVVERHGGTITVNDNGDEPGTTFVVRLPVSDEAC
jgi:PAS domain S-box-containing protein